MWWLIAERGQSKIAEAVMVVGDELNLDPPCNGEH